VIAALVAAAALSSLDSSALDAAVERERTRQHTAAVSLAIARDGEIVYAKGYGDADPALRIAALPQTIYAIGSITKQFTAALVMQLVEQGKVRLDAKLSTYLPDAPHAGEVTVRYLLDQRSGLPDYLADPFVIRYLYRQDVTPAQLIALIAGRPLAFTPGSRWEYSNTNYVLLGMLIEKITGAPYDEALKLNILRPLQLTSTTAAMPPPGPDVAIGMAWDESKHARESVQRWSSQVAYAAGTLNSTVLDLIAWDAAFFGNRVVSAASVREMTTAPALPDGRPDGYGFGWIISKVYGRREVWHNGGIPGFGARNSYFPDDHVAIAVLADDMSFDSGPIVREALAAALGLTAADRAPFDHPAPAPGENAAVTALARGQFDALRAGALNRALYTQQMNDAMSAQLLDQLRVLLTPLGPVGAMTFVSKNQAGDLTIYVYKIDCAQGSIRETMALDAAGKIAGLLVRPWDT
jgi:CubicO group peptidase (beta-lactamase class C family)